VKPETESSWNKSRWMGRLYTPTKYTKQTLYTTLFATIWPPCFN